MEQQQQQQQPPRLYPKKKTLISMTSAREQRRKAVLQRQREARRELTDHLRDLVLHATRASTSDDHEEVAMAVATDQQQTSPSKRGSPDGRRRRKRGRQEDAQYYASQFSIPEWMVEIPKDLHANDDAAGWFVMARPEGRRCLLVASGGITVTRLATGEVLHRFPSALPNGWARSKGSKDGWTLLDCIYHEPNRTYYVLDLLCWRNMELYDCTCEFRLFFLRSKFAEDLEPLPSHEATHTFRLVPLLYSNSDPAGIRRAYADAVPFVRDGLLFFDKQGYYEMGLSPLALVWKDRQSSRYFLTQPLSCVLRVQQQPLAADNDGGCDGGGGGGVTYTLCTLEGLVVGKASATDVMTWGLRQEDEDLEGEGTLVRFLYSASIEDEATNQHQLHGLQFDKRCSWSRATADPWSKLLFHSRAAIQGREGMVGGITVEALLQAAVHEEEDDDDSAAMR